MQFAFPNEYDPMGQQNIDLRQILPGSGRRTPSQNINYVALPPIQLRNNSQG
jgi:hypothetical protein